MRVVQRETVPDSHKNGGVRDGHEIKKRAFSEAAPKIASRGWSS